MQTPNSSASSVIDIVPDVLQLIGTIGVMRRENGRVRGGEGEDEDRAGRAGTELSPAAPIIGRIPQVRGVG